MSRNILGIVVVVIAITLGACGSDDTTTETGTDIEEGRPADGTQRLWIKPDLVDCEGVGPQTCMQIAESEAGDYQLFYDGIEGFTFEEGTTYVIDVTVEEVADPPADGSSLLYTLVEIVEQS